MWQTDRRRVRELGLRYLRYGPPIYKIFKGRGEYDWSILDPVMAEMRRLGVIPIIDLVHFGLPDWLGNFQNPERPDYFADFSRQFPARDPLGRYYTPGNAMSVTALFSPA